MKSTFNTLFQKPSNTFRGAPFWAWNGALEPEELRRQIRLMHRMGLGGFFMHSRVGLDTAYLSKDWFDCVKACIDEAGKLKMNAWLYDEDRWPSGAAGGLVTRNPKYRARSLVMARVNTPAKLKWDSNTLAVFSARVEGSVATHVQPVARKQRPPALADGECFLQFKIQVAACSDWYNGFTYLDVLNHTAVKRFIQVTYEAYRKNIRDAFGGVVPGIFTDEPNHGSKLASSPFSSEGTSATPWTDRLPAIFKKRYGYDLIPHLVEVFFDVDGELITPARHDYHDCVTHLFCDAFMRQIGEWADKNGILFTGHLLAEDSLSSQTSFAGSAMRSYEHMQAPGMDLLTEHRRYFDTAKQVSSVARQFGRQWRLTETYGCTGWDFPFFGHKALGDWQAALGINFRCQHLSWYTMQGEAKRDYPAGIFYQSPWWELYPKVEDYFARVNAFTTQGVEVRDTLVIHPVESMWTLVHQGWDKEDAPVAYNRMLIALSNTLLSAQLDFDYGDEELLSRHGRVTVKDGKPLLKVAKASYRQIVVPRLLTMRSSTLALLQKFKATGGEVIFAGEAAQHVDAKPSPAAVDFARLCASAPASGPGLATAVESLGRRIRISCGDGAPTPALLTLLREDKDCFYLFVCNTSEDFSNICSHGQIMARDRHIAYPDVHMLGFAGCHGHPVECDPESGRLIEAAATSSNNQWDIQTSFAPLASRLFMIPKTTKASPKAERRMTLREVRKEALAPAAWSISRSENNALVLDRPRFKIGQADWQPELEILRVDNQVRQALGISPRGGAMVQPWARKKPVHPRRVPVSLNYTFDVETPPTGNLFLAVERPETMRITVNGYSLNADAESGWWCDRSTRLLRVEPACLRLGKNEIAIVCDYDETHSGLEIVYLLGDFGVKLNENRATLTPPPATLACGDWVAQGLPFYAGHVAYAQTIKPVLLPAERLIVRVPEYRGVAVRVLVNGQTAGIIAWEPNEVDITPWLGQEPVQLAIEIIGHRRNSHGPFHHQQKWPEWTGPNEYRYNQATWFDGYQLVPCGLMQPPELIVRA